MRVSRKLRSRISKTKKKLSNDRWYIALGMLALFVVLAASFMCYRLTSLPMDYSIVKGDIPVMAVNLDDPSYHRFAEKPEKSLSDSTPTVVLDDEGNFFFGSMQAFTTGYHDVRNKYVVRSNDGSPQTGQLLSLMNQWMTDRYKQQKIAKETVAVFVPSSQIPMPIVIKVMAELRYSEVFDRVILANGML